MASSRKPARSSRPAAGAARQPASPVPAALAASLERCAIRKTPVCVALSGGVDSVVLLHALAHLSKQYGLALTAMHVNHGLSPSASLWARHCATLCRRLRVPLTVRRVKVTARKGRGLEAAARTARYGALNTAKAAFVALAHHADDQAETVLLNLLRGAGVRGAAAMPEVGDLPESEEGAPRAFRPLLAVTRDQIAAYAIEHRLHWDEDESNGDEALTRNWVRRSLAPVIGARFPNWRESLARAAAHFAEAEGLLNEEAAERLSVDRLRRLAKPRAKLLLRGFLRAHGARAPDAKRLDEMLRQLVSSGGNSKTEFAIDGKALRVFRDEIALQPASMPLGKVLFHPCKGAGIDAAKLHSQPVAVRTRQGGERLRLAANRPSRSLKNLFQEAGIPPWERDRLPLVYSGDELVWVPGLGIAAGFEAGKGRAGLLPEWVRDPAARPRKSP